MGWITEFDRDVVYYVYNNTHDVFGIAFFVISFWVQRHGYGLPRAAMLFSRKWRLKGNAALSLGISAVLGNYVLKNIFCRNRPFVDDPTIQLLIAIPHGYYSFPSGHSITAGASAISVFIRNKAAGAAAIVLALLICFSRVFFAVHYPTDIIAGFILGAVCAVFVYKLLSKKFRPCLTKFPDSAAKLKKSKNYKYSATHKSKIHSFFNASRWPIKA